MPHSSGKSLTFRDINAGNSQSPRPAQRALDRKMAETLPRPDPTFVAGMTSGHSQPPSAGPGHLSSLWSCPLAQITSSVKYICIT